MGLWGRVKKAAKRIGQKVEQKVLPIATQGLYKPREKGGSEDDSMEVGQRAAAAKRLGETTKQAGGGQIKYQTEEETTT